MNFNKRNFFDNLISVVAWGVIPATWIILVFYISFPEIIIAYFTKSDQELNKEIITNFIGTNWQIAMFMLLMIVVDGLFLFTKKGIFRTVLESKYALIGILPIVVYIICISFICNLANKSVIDLIPNVKWWFNGMGIALASIKVIVTVAARQMDLNKRLIKAY